MNVVILTIALAGLVGMPTPPTFYPPEQEEKKENVGHAITEVRTDVGWIGPNQTFHVVLLITPDDGWHVYWKNPGVSGAPTEIEIITPEGFVVGEPIFPRPTIFHGEEGQTYGYSEPAAIFIPVTAPDNLIDGRTKFKVTTSWLSCKKTCVMGEETKELTVSTHSNSQGPLNKDMRLSTWMKQLPQSISDLEDGRCIVSGNTLVITGSTKLRPITFIGIENSDVRFETQDRAVFDNESFRIHIPLLLDTDLLRGDSITINGLLMLGRNAEDPCYVVHIVENPETAIQ